MKLENITQNLAKNKHLITPARLPKLDFPVVNESNLNIEEEARKTKDKEEVVGIVVQENADNTKTVAVRLKSDIVCGFPLDNDA